MLQSGNLVEAVNISGAGNDPLANLDPSIDIGTIDNLDKSNIVLKGTDIPSQQVARMGAPNEAADVVITSADGSTRNITQSATLLNQLISSATSNTVNHIRIHRGGIIRTFPMGDSDWANIGTGNNFQFNNNRPAHIIMGVEGITAEERPWVSRGIVPLAVGRPQAALIINGNASGRTIGVQRAASTSITSFQVRQTSPTAALNSFAINWIIIN